MSFEKFLSARQNSYGNPDSELSVKNVDLSEYTPYLGGAAIYPSDDLELRRAKAQSGLEQTGRTLGNLLPNIGLGIIESAGYLGALAIEWGDDRDYSNDLTKFAQENRNPLGETYRENQEVFDFDDPAWWLNNSSGLLESIASFYATGAGVGSGLKSLSKGILGKMMVGAKSTAQATRLLNTGSRIGTAAALSYTEGAMVGAEVFEKKYEELLNETVQVGIGENGEPILQNKYTEEQAREAASQGAASAVRFNTVINTALNYTSVAPLFKRNKNLVQDQFRRLSGETDIAYKNRIKNLAREDKSLPKWLGYGSEAAQEGVEELVNQFAEKAGLRLADKYLNGETSFLSKIAAELQELPNFAGDVSNDEGLLSFIMGAIGGSGQKVLIDNIKSQKVPVKDANGETVNGPDGLPKYERVSPVKAESIARDEEFNGFKNDIVEDLTYIDALQQELKSAAANGEDTEYIREKLFNIQNYRSFRDGTADFLKQSLSEIGEIDNKTDLGAEMQPKIDSTIQSLAVATETGDVDEVNRLSFILKALQDKQNELLGKSAAMVQGLAENIETDDDINDPFYYKNLVDRKIKEVDEVNESYKEIRELFNFAPYDGTKYADTLVYQNSNIRSAEFVIEHRKSLVEKLRKNKNKLKVSDDFWNITLDAYQEKKSNEKAISELITKLNNFDNLSSTNKNKFLLTKAISEQEFITRTAQEIEILRDAVNDLNTKIEESIRSFETEDTNFEQATEKFFKVAAENEAYIQAISEQEGTIKAAQAELDADRKIYNNLITPQGRDSFLRNYSELSKMIAEDYENYSRQQKANATVADSFNKKEDVKEVVEEYQEKDSLSKEERKLKKDLESFTSEYEDDFSIDNPSQADRVKRIGKAVQDYIPIAESFDALGLTTYEQQLDRLKKIIPAKNLEKVFRVFRGINIVLAEISGDNELAGRIRTSSINPPTEDEINFTERGNIDEEIIVNDTELNPNSSLVDITTEAEQTETRSKSLSGSKINYAPRPYIATGEINKKTGEEIFRTIGLTKEKSSIELEIPSLYPVGTEITLTIDTDFDGDVRENGGVVKRSFNHYYKNGDISIDVPIQIFAGDKAIGYIPTQNWLEEKDAFGNYRNIADEYTVGDTVIKNNVKLQLEQNRLVRETIINNFKNGVLNNKTIISNRGKGIISTARDENGRKIFDSGSLLLPDTNLKFAIGKNESLFVDPDVTVDAINNPINIKDGYLYAVVPMGDGSTIGLPVQVNKLGENNASIIISQIENFLNQTNTNIVPEFNISKASGLNKFIRKYFAYITDKNKKNNKIGNITITAFETNLGFPSVSIRLHNLFSFEIQKGFNLDAQITVEQLIKYEEHELEKKNTVSKELYTLANKTYREVLTTSISNALFAPQLTLEGEALLNEGFIRPLSLVNGDIHVSDRIPYNEYVKQNITTDINGTNYIEPNKDERVYTYVDNTIVNIDTTPFIDKEVKKKVSIKLAKSEITPIEGKKSKGKKKAEKGLGDYEDDFSIVNPTLTLEENINNVFEEYKQRYLISRNVTVYQQEQAVNSLIFMFRNEFDNGNTNIKSIFDKTKKAFEKSRNNYIARTDGWELDNNRYNVSEEEAIYFAAAFNDSLVHFNELTERAILKLNKIGFKIKGNDAQPIKRTVSEIIEGLNVEFDGEEGKALERFDELSFELDPRNTASARVKLFLSTVKNPETSSYLGTNTYYDYQDIYTDLLRINSNNYPSLSAIIDRIAKENKGYAPYLIDMIKKTSLQNQKELVKVLTMQNQNFVMLSTTIKKNGENDLKVSNSNRGRALDLIKEEWNNLFKLNGARTIELDGTIQYDKEKIAELWSKISVEKPIDTDVLKYLNAIGIDFNQEMLEVAKTKKPSKKYTSSTWSSYFKKGGIFYILNETIINTPDFETENIFTNEDTILNYLGNIYLQFNPIYYTDNHISVDGKNIYDYGLNNRLSDFVRSFSNEKFVKRKKSLPFSKRSSLLKQIEKNSANVSLHYIDGVRKKYSSLDGKTYNDMSDREKELFIIGLFQNKGASQSYFLNPPHADKHTRTALRYNKVGIGGLNADLEFSDNIKSRVSDIIESELDYILTNQINILDTNSKEYKTKSLFYFFPNLNYHNLSKILTKQELATVYTVADTEGYGKLNDSANPKFKEILQREAENYLKQLINNRVEYWKKIDFNFFDIDYIKHNTTGLTDSTFAAADLELNYFFHNVNYYQLIAGHPSNFAKYIPNNIEATFNTTVIEVFKRNAKELAPGFELEVSKLNPVTDKFEVSETFKAINVADVKEAPISDYINNSPALYEAYANTNVTDAAGLASLEEFISISLAEGKISEEVYREVLKKEESESLTDIDLAAIFGPKKPVIVSDIETPIEDVPTYIKYSVIPLIKQFTRGTQLEQVRQNMKKNNIDLLFFKSAMKSGNIPTTSINADFAFDSQEISRSGFKIQQEVPFKDKRDILTVSQMNKLITEGILDIKSFDYKGEKRTGEWLRNEKDRIRIALFELSKDRLYKKLGITIVDDIPVISNLQKIANALRQEAISRGFNQNDVDSIAVITENGQQRFAWPLLFNNSGFRLESVLNSIVSNIIVRQKVPGSSYVQAPDVNLTRIITEDDGNLNISDTGIVYLENYTKRELGYVDIVEGKVQPAEVLVPWRFKDDEGNLVNISDYTYKKDGRTVINTELLPEEVLELVGARIPNQSHSSMLPMKIVGFLPNGMTDTIIVPKGITTQMGSDFDVDKLYSYMRNYHIKNNKFNVIRDNFQVEDKEFELKTLRKKVIDAIEANTPVEELDDDIIDLLSYMERENLGVGQSVLQFIDEQIPDSYFGNTFKKKVLQNEYIDLHWSILTNKEVINKVLQPLETDDLKNEKKLFIEIGLESNDVQSLASLQLNENVYTSNRAGKFYTGSQSVANTFNAITQKSDLQLAINQDIDDYNVIVKRAGQEDLKLSFINDSGKAFYNGELRTKSLNIVATQNAGVDNAKEQLLDIFNFTEETAAAINTMLLLNSKKGEIVNLTSITRFMKQPIIVSYVKNLKLTNDLLSTNFEKNKSDFIYNKLLDQYQKLMVEAGRRDMADESIFVPSSEKLLELLKESLNPQKSADFYEEQLRILQQFKILDDIGMNLLVNLQSSINTDSKGLPSNVFDLNEKAKRIENIKNQVSDNGIYLTGIDSLFYRDSQTETGYLANVVLSINNLFSNVFPYGNFTDVFDSILETVGKQNLTNDDKRTIIKNIKAFILSDVKVDSPFEVRKQLTIKQGDKLTLAERILETKRTEWGKRNKLLSRLYAEIPVNTNNPHYVTYNNSKVDDVASETLILSFIEVYENDLQLFNDLVNYGLITGGIQDINSFIQYVPVDYLMATGIGSKLNSVLENNSFDRTNFIEQFFQHFPERTKQIKNDLGSLFVLPTPNFEDSKFKYKDLIIKKVVDGEINYTYPDYISYRDNNNYLLYKLNKDLYTEKGIYSYMQIDNLGDGYTYEYQPENQLAISLINANRVGYKAEKPSGEGFLRPGKETPTGTPEVITNPILDEYGFVSSESGKSVVTQVLNNIKKKESNYSVLAEILQQSISRSNYIFNTSTVKSSALFNGRTRTYLGEGPVSFIMNAGRVSTEEAFVKEFLHESLHIHTSHLVKRWKLNRDLLPEEQSKIINKIDILRDRVITSLINKGKGQEIVNSFRSIYDTLVKVNQENNNQTVSFDAFINRVSPDLVQFTSKAEATDAAYYSLNNIEEFIAGTFTNESFVRLLNSIELDNMSVMSKFVKFIQELVISIGEVFGIQINEKSVLKEAIKLSTELIHSSTIVPEYSRFITHNNNKYQFKFTADGMITSGTKNGTKMNNPSKEFNAVVKEGNITVTLADSEKTLVNPPKSKFKPLPKPLSSTTFDGDFDDFSIVDYTFKAIRLLQSNKAIEVFKKGEKNNWSLDKILSELQVPKEQKQLLLDLGITDREQLIVELSARYSYTVEVDEVGSRKISSYTKIKKAEYDAINVTEEIFNGEHPENTLYVKKDRNKFYYRRHNIKSNRNGYFTEEKEFPQIYSNLTVPGGINYRENEIKTPLITPSIKGHAAFSTDNGIGWFRSDEEGIDLEETRVWSGRRQDAAKVINVGTSTGTRRILEIQSDLFQKGRDLQDLTIQKEYVGLPEDTEGLLYDSDDESQFRVTNDITGNKFLQLLNKDNNWVKFFTKSIIQDSARKGYKSVLFPTGNTAAKVEGHTTLEEFKRQKEERLASLEKNRKAFINYEIKETPDGYTLLNDNADNVFQSIEDLHTYRLGVIERHSKEIVQIKLELRRVEEEGFGTLKPIYNFYENTLTNIIKKQGYNPTVVKDEYGNTWNEVEISTTNEDEFDFSIADVSPAISKTISHIENRIFKIRNNLKAEKNSNKRLLLEQRISELINEIENLRTSITDDYILEVGMKELNNIEKLLVSPSYSELVDISISLAFWSDVKNIVYSSLTPSEGVLGKIQNKTKDLYDKYLLKSKLQFIQDGKSKGYDLQLDELENLQPDGVRKSYSLTLDSSVNKFVQYLGNTLNTSSRSRDESITKKVRLLEKLSKGVSKDELKSFFQKDSDGESTGNLVNEYSQKWYDALIEQSAKRKKKLESASNNQQKRKAYKEWFEFLNKNKAIVNTAVFFQRDEEGKLVHSDEDRTKEKAYLTELLGEKNANQLIEKSGQLYEEYKAALLEYDTFLDVEQSVGNIDAGEALAMRQNWILANSPITYYSKMYEGLIDETYTPASSKYVATAPKKYINGKQTEWYDKDYEAIQNDEKLSKLYDFITDVISDFFDVVPSYLTEDLQSNFLFQVKKSFVERLTSSNMKGIGKYMSEEFINNITTYDDTDVVNKELDATGRPEKVIPVRFIQQLSAKDRSDDLIKIVEAGIAMIENYKFLSKVESKVVLANNIIQQANEIALNGSGNVIRKENGSEPLTLKNGVATLKQQVQYTVDALLYGQKKQKEGISSTKIGLTREQKDNQKSINRALNSLEIQKEQETISDTEYKEKKQELEDQLKSLGGEHFSVTKLGDFMIRLTQLKAMGYNPFTAFANLGFGVISNTVHASGGQDFNGKDLSFAFGIMLDSTKKSMSGNKWVSGTANKVANIMDNLGVMGEVIDSNYGESISKRRGKWKSFSPYVLLRTGDFFVKGMTTVAMLNNVKLASGKTLWQAFNEDGEINPELLTEEEQTKWLGSLENDEEAQEYKKFKNKVIEVNKVIHGNFDPSSPTLFKKYLLGRLVGQFKFSWMSTGIESRFGKEYYNSTLGRNVKGRYRTYQTVYKNEGMGGLLGKTVSNLVKKTFRQDLDLGEMTETDKANFKRNLAELQWGLSITALVLMLKGLKDDEDEENDVYYNLAINSLFRINQDIYFYSSPKIFQDLTRNVIPATSILNDGFKALQGTSKYMFDEDYEGELAIKRWTKAFPYLNLYNKFEYQTENIRNQ
jgi:type VI protein secretion system component Hcp